MTLFDVKSVFWLFLNMLQHVLGNNLQFNFCARQVINKETPPHGRLLPKTCCGMFRRSRSTDFTCAMSQAVRILNICKTFHEIQVPLNFLYKFTGINLVQLNINPVEFHFIRLCSLCNIYMLNDVKFFETPCILSANNVILNKENRERLFMNNINNNGARHRPLGNAKSYF